jgi:parallel beta-helix repeat protein
VCEQNARDGIEAVVSGTSTVLINNQCRGNKNAGIYFSGGASGRAENNLCENNGWSDLILNASSPYLSANRLERNAQYGIAYGPPSRPKFGSRNAFAGNTQGEALTNATFK